MSNWPRRRCFTSFRNNLPTPWPSIGHFPTSLPSQTSNVSPPLTTFFCFFLLYKRAPNHFSTVCLELSTKSLLLDPLNEPAIYCIQRVLSMQPSLDYLVEKALVQRPDLLTAEISEECRKQVGAAFFAFTFSHPCRRQNAWIRLVKPISVRLERYVRPRL